MDLMKLVLFLSCVVCACCAGDKASFYGASYISTPLQEARSSSDVRMKFRTHREDALLLLAAGRTDFLMMRLENGRVSVHINLGAGESQLMSPNGLKFNDMTWHDVIISRQDANLTLQIDEQHTVRKHLPGRFFELNIHYGVFLGGQGNFSELFLGHMDNFRGCLAEVQYNGVSILQKARERSGNVLVVGVTWNCAAEFDADVNTDISFVQDGAYMVLAKTSSRAGARWQLELKSMSMYGTLLYNTGQNSRADFVAVEIIGGRVRVLLNKGNAPATEIYNPVEVANGMWHKVDVTYNPTIVEVTVDGVTKNQRLPLGGPRYLDLGENYYVGGMEFTKKERATGKGLKTATYSFKGCLRNMELDGRAVGLPTVRVTQGTVGECVWRYPCTEPLAPCVEDAQCVQQGVDGFKCQCDQPLCVNSEYAEKYKVFSKSSLPVDLEMLNLTPLLCEEGGSVLVTSDNIHIALDYPKYGVRDSGVVFHIIEPPTYGQISIELAKNNVFTLHDLTKEKVKYNHYGSENYSDHMVLELELTADSRFTLPAYLQGRHRFVLHVNVTPVNDPPVLVVGTERVLRIAEGTRKILTTELIQAKDSDTPASDLWFTIHNPTETEATGHLERDGAIVDTFSQVDLEEGLISYVHHSSKSKDATTQLTFQVSDGVETSVPAYVKIAVIPLQLKMVNNTGLILVYKSFAFITSSNLTFSNNADEGGLIDVRYDIVTPPQFGCVQRLREVDSSWQCVEYFTSQQVVMQQIRYLHSNSLPTHDEFKFRAIVGETSSNVYDFRITFTKLRIGTQHSALLELNGTREALITAFHLLYQTEPMPTSSANIMYTIVTTPKYGGLHLGTEKKRLQIEDTFTQQDLDLQQVRYRFHRRAYSHIHDEFIFRVSIPECEDVFGTFNISHIPQIQESFGANLKRLQVTEGSKMAIPHSNLNFDIEEVSYLIFNITNGPEHGWLEVVNEDMEIIRKPAKYFISGELEANRVYYVHDNSETRHDSFHFMALSTEVEDFQYVEVFHIDVLLLNDNSPASAFDRVFHVVTGGTKLITGNDLRYEDADIDTKDADIIYTRRNISNGGIYDALSPNEPLFQFSQEDLNHNKVLFKHNGEEYGKINLWITDGQFDVNGVLEVQASAPFIRNVENNGSVVQNGRTVMIRNVDLSVETNLNCKYQDIVYLVTEQPKQGVLEIDGETTIKFTQQDIEDGRIIYRSTSNAASRDYFKYVLSALDANVESMYYIKIYPACYWEPLRVIANNTLYVEESTSVAVTKSHLEVMHPQISSDDITYIVSELPEYGYLEVQKSNFSTEDDLTYSRVFDQSIIDSGKLHYIQSGVNKTKDRIIFNVTNGISWLNGLELNILVVPEHLYIGTKDLFVVEGKSSSLSTDNFVVISEYYRGRVTEYKIVKQPSFGALTFGKLKDKLTRFTNKQLEAKAVTYIHNGSENGKDNITIIGVAEGREGVPSTLHINVIPVNDEPPVVLTNTGLDMWEGGVATIGANDLFVRDNDSPPESLQFNVLLIRGGYTAMATKPDEPVTTFTQSQINTGDVVFVHLNGSNGKILFSVTDGLYVTTEQSFFITTNPVMLKLINKNNFHVFPLLRKPLTAAHLLSVSTDQSREIKYMVKNGPFLGRLVMDSDDTGYSKVVNEFTQLDINISRVFYEHTHPFSSMYANDSFVFDVASHLAETLTDQRLDIDISVSSGGLDRFISVTPLHILEGGTAVVRFNLSAIIDFLESHAGLMSPVIHAHASQPQHGTISFMQDPNITIYSQNELDSGQVKYQHDHSDSTQDCIKLAIYLLPQYVLLCNVTIPIIITPINDQPFRLITQAPYISVVQGENKTVTSEDLLTEDLDTPPEELIYDVISGPTQGRLILLPDPGNDNRDELANVNKFCQADINAKRIVYEHSGQLQTTSFYFRVWDGKFKPSYTVFNIHVLPIELNVSVGEPVYLQQGQSVADLNKEQFFVETNANRNRIMYNVSKVPAHGVIYVRDVPAMFFRQSDLESQNVMYMQNDMTKANDTFQVSASITDGSIITHLDVLIQVQPLMQLNSLLVTVGDKCKISLQVLDATPLAKLTSSNPTYTVFKKPRYGKLKKIIRSSGERRNVRDKEVTSFTHEEISSGVIYYIPKKTTQDITALEDSLRFSLCASIFQPAIGDLRIRLQSPVMLNEIPGPSDPESREGGLHVASPNISSDYLLIVSMVGGVVVLGISVIAIIKCRNMEPSKDEMDKDVQPIPLPRPPDHLMPHSPHVKRYISSEDSLPMDEDIPLPSHSDVPHCKVIALSPVESMMGSEIDMNIRYPYGDDPTEDWNTYDISEIEYPHRTTNPILRRNQYWV